MSGSEGKSGLASAVKICMDEQDELVSEAEAETDLFGQQVAPRGRGRPAGALNKETERQAAVIRASGQSPLAFLASIYRDESRALERRIEAAKACLPYVHKKQPIAIEAPDGGVMMFFGPPPDEADGDEEDGSQIMVLEGDVEEVETPTKSDTYEDGI